jgi:hypothetical protein
MGRHGPCRGVVRTAIVLSALWAGSPVSGADAQQTGDPALPAAGSVRPELRGQEQLPSPVFLASAVLPGSAQYLMGDDRWVPYIAVELWSLVSWAQQRRLARSLEQRYRDVAWQVPRRSDRPETRRDTVFEYYEAMAYYRASGGWMPDGLPERQAGTFNGDLWALAKALYIPAGQPATPGTAAFQAAVAYYQSRAIPPGYGWAWGGSNLEQQVFADLIVESDAAFRSASRYAGMILANHITSAVDALITARLRQLAGNGVGFESAPVPGAGGVRWAYGLRVSF